MAETETQPSTEKQRGRGPIDPRLIRRASATKGYLISGVVVGCLTAVLILCQAHLISRSVTDVFASHTMEGVALAVGLLILVLVGRGILAWLSAWLAQRTSAAVKSQLRRDILAARLDHPAHQTSSSSNLVNLVTQGLDALDGYFSKYLPQLLLAATVPVILLVAVVTNDLLSAAIIAVTIPFIPILMILIGKNTEKKIATRWAFQARLANHFADLISGLPTLQVFGRAKAQAQGLKRTEHANRRETLGILRMAFLSAFTLELFATLAVAVIALVIGTRLLYGQVDFYAALFVLVLAPEVYLPIRQVGVHYHDSAHGLAAAEAAFKEIDRAGVPEPSHPADGALPPRLTADGALPPRLPADDAPPSRHPAERSDSQGPDTISLPSVLIDSATSRRKTGDDNYPPSVVINNLAYTYPQTGTTVGPFTLEVNPGEIVALAGKSGGGKTTVVNCILGFLTPSETEDVALTLGGVDARVLDLDRWRETIAYVPQIPGMLDGTIADNVRLGYRQATEEQVREVLGLAGAGNLEPSREVGEEGEGLSVGERRRVGIARALARINYGTARFLILDEPTAGLDTDTEAKVLSSVRDSGATALVVSHRSAVLQEADRVVEINPRDVESLPALADETGGEVVGETAMEAEELETAGSLEKPDKTGELVEATVSDESEEPEETQETSQDNTGDATGEKRPPVLVEDEEKPVPSLLAKGSPLLRLVYRLLNAVPGAKGRLALAILLSALASGATIALMGTSAWMLSRAAQHPLFEALAVAAVGVRFFGISRGVFRYVERLVGHSVALSMQSALRLKTYQALAKTTLLGRKQGDLLVRVVADVNGIEDVIVRIVQPFLSAGVVVLGVCAMLAVFSPGVAVAVLVSAIGGGLLVPWLTQRVSLRDDERAVPLRGDLGVVVHDLSRNAIDLAAYGARGQAIERMDAVDQALVDVEEKSAWAKGIGAGLQVLASGIGVLGGLIIGAVGVVNGSLGETMLAVMVLVPLALHEVFANFAQAAQTWTRAKASLLRVTSIIDAPPIGIGDVQVRDASEEPSLVAKGLAIGWPGFDRVADGLELSLRAGEAVGVMGPSGVGKTTLAATIMGLIPVVDGELVTAGRIGYLAQDAHIFSTTISENVRIGNKDASEDEVRAALVEAGLDIPLDRQTGEMGVGLSGGEARRLALARLFVGDYRLLILDEPTEHLDRETADALMDELFAGVDQRPILVISHDESVAARCDRVLTM
ncbi:MAG: thiol reductant ABC exporter subunit CydD [Propionibacteriaceae bacterium]|nr:thiol reductant ABC exporter subunit CydD [Propionibacteriaceae bacterium]